MKKVYFLLFFILFSGFISTVQAQNISNEGSDFWIPFPTHDPNGTDLANMNVFVTCKYKSEVTVSCGTSYTETQIIPANTIVAFSVPRTPSYIDVTDANKKLTNRAIHVVTTAGQPNVAVYAHIYAGARSAASLILPKEALGQKYYSMNYTQDVGGKGFLVLVAVEDNTTLLIHATNGTTTTVTLPKAGDVYEYMPNTANLDLTGTFVEVDATSSQCKRFAAFSGSTSNTIQCAGSRDPLYQQLYTIGSWGKNYGVVPFIDRRYILRILAQENNTTVNVNGTNVVINKGQFYESPLLTTALTVTADKLVCVAQYSLTQGCSTITGGNIIGDPEMVLLNPTEFNIKNITVFSSSNRAIQTKYVNVYMKTDKTSTFKLNGTTPTKAWQTVPSNSTYSYIQLQVFDDGLTLTADDGFNAIAYGFGNAESYAYSAGTTLASSQFLILVNKSTNKESASTCVNQPSDFKLTLPFLLDKIIWKLGDGDPDYIDNAPSPTSSVVNGETLYTYTAPVNKTFTTIGQKNLSAVATLSVSQGVCSSSDIDFTFTVQVDPLPLADFDVATVGCSEEIISFTDKSTTGVSGKKVTKWTWDFNDGSAIESSQNPTHTFALAGTYNVKLTVETEEGCGSLVVTKQIIINPKPKALFTAKKNTCIATEVTFTDQSTVATGGVITKWTWDFGDGSAVDHTQNPKHSYSAVGKYTITLIIETDKGCLSLPHLEEVAVTALPTVDFSLPDVCLSDAEAIFINLSKDQDGTTAGLTYQWDFGEPSSGVSNKSILKDGRHKYGAAGIYTVILTVTNINGCVVTKKESNFTVNGSVPIATFVPPAQATCSNQPFSVTNTSTVDFGDITRIEWYIDDVLYSFDEQPVKGKEYMFTYPQFYDRPTKTIRLKLVAFSGSVSGSCSNFIEKIITLKASPVVEFNPVAPICMNAGLIKLEAKELGGLPGNGEFSGVGVSTQGVFNPSVARVGIHDITYTFLADNGCSHQITQQIEVYPVPQINAGDDFYLLAGGEKRIEATVTGNGLTYKWVPSLGLDRDDILNPIARPEQDTKYILTVTSGQGCAISDQVYVYVLQSINAPNSFTPNGDGINDVWNVKYLDTYPNATVEIYDRTGQRIYFSKGYAVPFDGRYKNQPLPVGTYYYIINPNSGRKSITGNLTIIK
jgi:gliding motility-associated-like protein